jgi:hypothetical protein
VPLWNRAIIARWRVLCFAPMRTIVNKQPAAPEPTLADLAAAIAELRELIEQRLPAEAASLPKKMLTVTEASRLVGRTRQCVAGWCRDRRGFRVAIKVRGAWQIDPDLLLQRCVAEFGDGGVPVGLRNFFK